MNIYLFEYVSQVSDNWHSGGAVMVVAKDADEVKSLIADFGYVELTQADWDDVRVFQTSPLEAPEVFIFPDAGCC